MNAQHQKAQCRRLIAAVRELSIELDRPICSRDLMAYYARFPDKRPELWQALGQQLFKATRPAPAVDRVRQIGLIGNRAYYVADNQNGWKEKLARYHAGMVLARMVEENIPAAAERLLAGPREALARNALAGWHLEVEDLLPRILSPKLVESTAILVKRAQTNAAPSFAGVGLSDLVPRHSALAILHQEVAKRAAYKLETGVNWSRFLAGLAWPQSSLFPRAPGPVLYSKAQLALLAKTLWPESNEDPDLARAELLAMKYGLPD
jgi:hypothetical protein